MRSLAMWKHQQDDATSCGRACAQMIIGFEQRLTGVPPAPLQNQSVMAQSAAVNSSWSTTPDDLVNHINSNIQPPTAIYRKEVAWPSANPPDPQFDVASRLYRLVTSQIDAGHPAVLLLDSHDHWEVAWAHEGCTLYLKDPLPVGSPATHQWGDSCLQIPEDSVVFATSMSAGNFICDAAPYQGAGIAIVSQSPSYAPLQLVDGMPNCDAVDVPFVPSALRGLADWLRDLERLERVLRHLLDDPRVGDFQWSKAHVRHADFVGGRHRRFTLVGVPGEHCHLLLAFDASGRLERARLTRIDRLLNSLRASKGDTRPLWILPRHGRWQPFEEVACDRADGARWFRRLHDDLLVAYSSGDLRKGE